MGSEILLTIFVLLLGAGLGIWSGLNSIKKLTVKNKAVAKDIEDGSFFRHPYGITPPTEHDVEAHKIECKARKDLSRIKEL
jgi:hypothetical protein